MDHVGLNGEGVDPKAWEGGAAHPMGPGGAGAALRVPDVFSIVVHGTVAFQALF